MDNNFNNNYNNNYNYYNPVPAPNMNGNIKKRNSGAVALSILLGFFILFFITTLSLRLGLFHGNDLSESIKNSGVIELFQDELLNEMGKDVEYYHGEQEILNDSYSSLLELAQDVGSEQSVQTTVSIVYHSFAISVLVSAVVLGLLVIGCIVAIALIDKDAKLTVKGLFAPFFVPGIIIFIISLAIKIGSIVLMNGYNSMDDADKKLVTLFDQLAKVIINPFVIISGIVLVLGIVFLIVGKCMKNDNSGATL